ncbi:MAG TPA: hypothetical protein VKR32_05550 [Puia sp.]|nr:hypothetical protein [Puia sp.]
MTQFIKTLVRGLIILGVPYSGFSQSTLLPQESKSDHFLDRMEILLQTNPDLNVTTVRPMSRQLAVQIADLSDSLHHHYPYDYFYRLSKIDQYDLQSLLMNNIEWYHGNKNNFLSANNVWSTFYIHKANFYEVNEKDFFLVIDPVVQQTQSVETGNSARVFLNSKGLTLRGMIADKVGFSAYLTDNQERGPTYFQQRVTQSGFPAVPGFGYYKAFKKTAFDYFENRASIFFKVWKYFDFQFGYDKNFIGDGYRSLFLSDYAAPYLFLKLETKIWKLDYQNIFMELISQHQLGDYYYPRKYAVVHHLSFNAASWLNLGLYENVTFSRPDYFDFSYLNPVIFLVSAQQQAGSPDKTTAGLDFKANVGHTTQFYGQLLINEFILDQIIHYSRGYWANKQGFQLGVKYINAFDLKNFDLQLETNVVRPYTYQHNDSVSNFSNYNQPLAHPLGANFLEFITIARYRPSTKLSFEGKMIYYRQGLDSAGVNFGSNVLENYDTRPRDYGFKIASGVQSSCFNTSLLASYELRENLFLDASVTVRNFSVADPVAAGISASNSTIFTVGIRLNAFRRQYDY